MIMGAASLSEVKSMENTLEVCKVLESITAIPFEPDSMLRMLVPNSLILVQAMFALESELGATIDMASLDYNATPTDLANALILKSEEDEKVETEDEGIPLSPIQTAYLLGSEDDIELGGQATFIYAEASYECSRGDLLSAIQIVLDRHDIFDYEIDLEEGVMRPGERQVSVGSNDATSPQELLRVREDLQRKAKKSNEKYSLVHIEVCGSGPCKLLGYFNMVIMDAGSLYILFNEIESVLKGKKLPEALPIAKAVKKTISRDSEETVRKDIEYWRKKVESFPTPPEPAQRVMGTTCWNTRRFSESLDAQLVTELSAVADRAGASLSALILACCAAVVARWHNAPGMVCNVTVSRRTALGAASAVIGDFTSSMLVGIDTSGVASISELATKISQDMFEGLAHGSVGGVEIMADMMRSDSDQLKATAPIVFTSYLGGETGIDVSLDFLYTQTAQVCLDMQAMPAGGGRINISWDVVPQYYPFAEDMFARLVALLSEVAAGNSRLPIRDANTEVAATKYNDTAVARTETTLLDYVERSVAKYPEKKAIPGTYDYTYLELWERSGRLADYLLELGIKPHNKVIVEFTKSPDDVVAMIAALRVGAAYVPVSKNLPAVRRQSIRESIPDSVVVTTEVSRIEGANERRSTDVLIRPEADDLAYLIFTSGSTGTPKGVEITHRGVVGTIRDVNRRYGVDENARIIGLSSLGFDLSVYDVFGAFAAGATLTMVEDERDADEILDILQREKITLWNSAPAIMELLLLRCEPGSVFKSVKTVLLSGDRIPASQPRRVSEVFPNARIYSLGGATEASIWSIQYPLQENSLEKRIPYGYPLENQRIHILSYDRVACPRGVVGQIWISGDGLATGYASAPEITKAAFQEVPGLGRCYKTGDLGIFNHEGFVEFCGREDRQVKVAGFRVELGEIEAVLAKSGLVNTSTALVLERSGRPALMCAYVPKAGVTQEVVHDELVRHLPSYMVPQILQPVDVLPMTVNGKLDQKALARLSNNEECKREIETIAVDANNVDFMREIFELVLGVPVEDLNASFFALGGDSLSFQMMLREVSRRSGNRLRFRDVVKSPTVQSTAALLEAAEKLSRDNQVVNSSEDSCDDYAPFPLTEMQMAYYVGRHHGFDLGGVGEHYYVESIVDASMPQFENALNTVVRHHDMLRAVFTEDGRQKILREVPRYRIEVEDFTLASEKEIADAVLKKRGELSHRRYDLGQWPLFDISAFALPDGTHRLFFSVDMIVGDGASQRIFIRDLSRVYRGETLPDVVGSYRNYVIAAREKQAERDALPLSAETERLIAQFPLGNVLPQRAAMPQVPRMCRLSWNVTKEMTTELKDRAKEQGVSLSTVLLVAYAKSLALFSLEGKVGINVTTYNRDLDIAGADNMFGDFTGIVLVDYDDAEEENALEVIQSRLLGQLGEGRSGVKLLAEMGRRRGFTGQALAPFVFTSLLFGSQENAESILGKVDYAISQTPQVLVDNQVMMVSNALNISFDFVERVLDPAVMQAIFERFKSLLESFAKDGELEASLPSKAARLLRDAWQYERVDSAAERGSPSQPDDLSESQKVVVQQIQKHLESQLGVSEQADLDASLFELGLDSLGFVQLVQKVQTLVGQQIPLAQALATPSLRCLIRLATKTSENASLTEDKPVEKETSSLVLLREGDSRSVVVMIHGGFGTVDIYRDLAIGMPKKAQVWGIQFAEFAKQWPQDISVSQIVSRYAEAIEHSIDPAAKIIVVGWSVGGTLAHALAGELGQRCAGLVLLDSLAPGIQAEIGQFDLASDMAILEKAGVEYAPANTLMDLWSELADDPGVMRQVASAISDSLLEDLGVSAGNVRVVDFSTLRTLIAARNGYQPDSYEATKFPPSIPVLMVLPDDGEAVNAYEWEGYVGKIETETVQGNHYSFITGPECAPTVNAVANFVAKSLTSSSMR